MASKYRKQKLTELQGEINNHGEIHHTKLFLVTYQIDSRFKSDAIYWGTLMVQSVESPTCFGSGHDLGL